MQSEDHEFASDRSPEVSAALAFLGELDQVLPAELNQIAVTLKGVG